MPTECPCRQRFAYAHGSKRFIDERRRIVAAGSAESRYFAKDF
jgi:hypothetical protein